MHTSCPDKAIQHSNASILESNASEHAPEHLNDDPTTMELPGRHLDGHSTSEDESEGVARELSAMVCSAFASDFSMLNTAVSVARFFPPGVRLC